MAANNISNTSSHIILSEDQINNKPVDQNVQKVVTVSGKQVILTNSKSLSNPFKRAAITTISNEQQKILPTETINSKGPPTQVVSILPTGSLSPSRGISLSSGQSLLKAEPASPVKVITVNASNISPHKSMPGSSTILNLGTGKKITLNTETLGGGDGKHSTTVSPQKLFVKGGQSVNVVRNYFEIKY